jgi:hypothetical protein
LKESSRIAIQIFFERTRKVDLRDTLGLLKCDSRSSAHALLPANGNGDDFFQNRHS